MDRDSEAYMNKLGIERSNPIKAIRRKCMDCMGGSSIAVDECGSTTCELWPFRKGKNPWRAAPSEKQVEAGKRLAEISRERAA